MAHTTKVKVALNLGNQPVPVKILKGRHYVTSMTGNANFTTPNPTLASVTTAINALETAANNAAGAGPVETAIMHEKETLLDNLLTQLGAYVEGIANNNAATAASIVLSAGMDLKRPNVPIGALLPPLDMSAKFGTQQGEIKLSCKKPVGARAIIWQISPSAAVAFVAAPAPSFGPASSADFPSGVTLSSKHIATGLTSGTSYTFRAAGVGGANQSGWSDVVVQMAP